MIISLRPRGLASSHLKFFRVWLTAYGNRVSHPPPPPLFRPFFSYRYLRELTSWSKKHVSSLFQVVCCVLIRHRPLSFPPGKFSPSLPVKSHFFSPSERPVGQLESALDPSIILRRLRRFGHPPTGFFFFRGVSLSLSLTKRHNTSGELISTPILIFPWP